MALYDPTYLNGTMTNPEYPLYLNTMVWYYPGDGRDYCTYVVGDLDRDLLEWLDRVHQMYAFTDVSAATPMVGLWHGTFRGIVGLHVFDVERNVYCGQLDGG